MLASLMLSLVVAAILIQVAVFSTTIFLHRTATHRALVLHPAVAWLFRLSLWLTTGIARRNGWRSTASITRSPTRKAIRTARR